MPANNPAPTTRAASSIVRTFGPPSLPPPFLPPELFGAFDAFPRFFANSVSSPPPAGRTRQYGLSAGGAERGAQSAGREGQGTERRARGAERGDPTDPTDRTDLTDELRATRSALCAMRFASRSVPYAAAAPGTM